jgi:HEAT repeat protein
MMLALLLAACGPAPDDIARAIHADNPVQREDGAKIAANVDDPAVIDALVAVLADPSESVRLRAVASLADLGATGAGPTLRARLAADSSPEVRRALADALGRLGVIEAAPELVAYVEAHGPDDRAQLAGLWALGALGARGLQGDARTRVLDALVARREATHDRSVRWVTSAALRTFR